MPTFVYPAKRSRRYQPSYAAYESYRSWLRDEFDFRCGYCLARETWQGRDSFQLDHFKPHSRQEFEFLKTEYSNLVYSCYACNNSKKTALLLIEPLVSDLRSHLEIDESGITGITAEGKQLVRVLKLHRKKDFYATWIRIGREAPEEALHFPQDLPDLTRKRPFMASSKRCYYSRRDTLPSTFVTTDENDRIIDLEGYRNPV